MIERTTTIEAYKTEETTMARFEIRMSKTKILDDIKWQNNRLAGRSWKDRAREDPGTLLDVIGWRTTALGSDIEWKKLKVVSDHGAVAS